MTWRAAQPSILPLAGTNFPPRTLVDHSINVGAGKRRFPAQFHLKFSYALVQILANLKIHLAVICYDDMADRQTSNAVRTMDGFDSETPHTQYTN